MARESPTATGKLAVASSRLETHLAKEVKDRPGSLGICSHIGKRIIMGFVGRLFNMAAYRPRTLIPQNTRMALMGHCCPRFLSTELPGKIEPRMLLGFTCTVCDTRTHRTISKTAYTQGIVLVECPSCKNRHVIADNLSWFEQRGEAKNVEEMLAQRGESVRTEWTRDEQGAVLECLEQYKSNKEAAK